MEQWNCLHLDVSRSVEEAVCALCHEAGSCGISIREDADTTHLEIFFPNQIDLSLVKKRLSEFFNKDCESSQNFLLTQIEAEDWTIGWRDFFRPVWVTPKIVVHPPWISIREKGVISIAIEPKMAFGTGGHESTQLCLQMLDERIRPGMNCLDLGTGSGILAIGAAMRGAAKVLAVDTDKISLENVAENIKLNGIDRSRVLIRLGSIDSSVGCAYDLIFANIQSSILRPMLTRLATLISPTGTILFSGLLKTEEEQFCQEIQRHGLNPIKILNKNEWIGISVVKGV